MRCLTIVKDEYNAKEAIPGKNLHRPSIIFRGNEVEKDNQADTKVYDPKFHYSQHSPDKLAELMAEFNQIRSGYERSLLEHSSRIHRLAVAYDEVSDLYFVAIL